MARRTARYRYVGGFGLFTVHHGKDAAGPFS